MKRMKRKRLRALIGGGALLLALAGLVVLFVLNVPKSVVTPLTNESEACAGLEKLTVSGSDWITVAQNGTLTLQLRPDTAEARVTDETTGRSYYTNPQDRDGEQGKVSSQVLVSYADSKNNIVQVNSCDLAVKNGQVSYWALENGFKAFYLLRQSVRQSPLPAVASYEDFTQGLLPLIGSARDRRKVQEGYRPVLLEPDALTQEQRDAIVSVYGNTPFMPLAADERADYIAKYPMLEQVGNCFVLSATGFKVTSLEKIVAASAFTEEDKNAFEEKVGVVHEDNTAVTVSLEYRLVNGALTVTAPAKDVTCSAGYRIVNLSVLPMMGASPKGAQGYALLPDGSGAIIRFKDAPRATYALSLSVYGSDPSLTNRASVTLGQPVMLPAYGIVSGDTAVFSVIEKGASLANLNVVLAGSASDHNAVYTDFVVAANAQITLQAVASDTAVRTYQLDRYLGDYEISYRFLSGDAASYSGMADALREKYLSDGVFTQRRASGEYALMAELLMGIDTTRSMIGFPIKRVTAATTFRQAETLLSELNALGVSGMNIALSGWQKGGTNHALQWNADAERRLGGDKGMESLLDTARALGAEIYPAFGASSLDTQKDGWFDGFTVAGDVPQTLRREPSRRYFYSPPTGMLDRSRPMRYLLTDAKKTEVSESYLRALTEKGFHIAFEEAGALIATDYDPNRAVSREAALATDAELMGRLSEGRLSMGSAANAYAYPYLDYIAALPAQSSLLDLYDDSVPFVQMVLHGYKQYAIEPLNASGLSREDMLLRVLETGSEPGYLWIAEEDSLLRDSDYQDDYSLSYHNWLGDAAALYRTAKAVLAPLSGATITSHDAVTGGVRRVTYDDGTRIYVNYGSETVIADGLAIPAKGYAVRGGSGR